MDIHVLKVTLEGPKIKPREIPRLRGFIASKFPEYEELHNHKEDSSFAYGYPMVQYKSLDGVPSVLAINEAARTLMKVFSEIDSIDLKDKILDIIEKGFAIKKQAFGTCDEMIHYGFESPWMALNQKNYEKYQQSDVQGRVDILKKVLVGNVISISKYLGYTVDKQLEVLVKLEPLMVNFKDQQMIAFKGEFVMNFQLPDYLGIGKSVSRGFGTVARKDVFR